MHRQLGRTMNEQKLEYNFSILQLSFFPSPTNLSLARLFSSPALLLPLFLGWKVAKRAFTKTGLFRFNAVMLFNDIEICCRRCSPLSHCVERWGGEIGSEQSAIDVIKRMEATEQASVHLWWVNWSARLEHWGLGINLMSSRIIKHFELRRLPADHIELLVCQPSCGKPSTFSVISI